MRHIRKGPPPQELINWNAANRTAINYNYRELPGPIKQPIRAVFV